MTMEPRLENSVLKIQQLVDSYRSGQLVIPEFQREYVWKKGRAPRLVDSLYRGFPISTLLIWNSDDGVRARRRDPRPSRSGQMSWLIDGQQRVITLSRILSGDEGIDVVFRPETEEFKLSNAATEKDRTWYRVAEILDEESYRHLRRQLPEGSRGERLEARFEKLRRVLSYEVPIVKMVDHSFDAAVDAFARINTLGVKLKSEDIESARVAARHTGFISDEVAPFLAKVRSSGFNRLNVMHLFRACAFIAHPDGRSRTPLHELDRNDVLSAWSRTKRATEDAIGIVRSELGLVNMDILWSGALLVPLIALCATSSPRERDSRAMAGWLVIAALLHRYSSASETALDQDLRACRTSDPIGALLTNVRREVGDIGVYLDDFGGSLMDKGALLGVYVACRHAGLTDLFTGSSVLLQQQVDRHHILPRAQFSEKQRSKADTVANIAFIVGSTNKSVGASSPDVYLLRISKDVLQSQCIPMDSALWDVSRAADFWTERRKLLVENFNAYLRRVLPGRLIVSSTY